MTVKAIWLVAWRQSVERPLRAGITVCGITLGVAVSVAIPMANVMVLQSFEQTVEAVTGRATLQASGGDLGLAEEVIAVLRAHPSVVSADPVVHLEGRLAEGPHKGQPLVILGMDLLEAFELKGIRVRTGPAAAEVVEDLDVLLDPDAVFLGARLAAEWHLQPGAVLNLLVGTRAHRLVVRGVVESQDGTPSVWDGLGVMDIAATQVQFGLIGRLDRIDLVTDPDRSVDDVAQELQALLPPSLTVSRPQRRTQQVERMVQAFQLNLATLSAVGLLVGLLLVYNTVSFAVVRRRREIGILRAIGMSRQGVLGLFMAQAGLLGLLGGVLGSGVGAVLTRGLVSIMGRTISDLYVPVAAGSSGMAGRPLDAMAQGVPIGLLVSLVGAIVPSLEASRTAPARALASGDYEMVRQLRAGRLAGFGAAGMALTALLAWPAPVQGIPLFGYLSAFCLLISLSCFSPAILGGLGRFMARGASVGRVAPRGLGGGAGRWIERAITLARLAAGQVTQTPGRSAVTISALMVGIAMMVGVGIMVQSFRHTVEIWVDQTVMADLVVAPAFWLEGGEAGMLAKRMPIVWAGTIAAVPGVAAVDPYRQLKIEIQGRPASLIARDLGLHAARSRYLFVSGNSAEIIAQAISSEGVLVSEVLARTAGVEPGAMLRLMTPSGEQAFSVAGVFYDYATDGGKVVMDRTLYRRFWSDETATVMAVYVASPESREQVRSLLQASMVELAGGDGQVVVIRNADLKAEILAIFDRTFKLTYVLELIAVVIALLGIVNTLLTSVLERQRELATLRAIGASQRQIRRLVLWESCYLGVLGAALGLIGGGLLSWLLVEVINKQSFGWTIHWMLPVSLLCEAVGLALAAALLAGYAPARWAARRPVVEGLRYE